MEDDRHILAVLSCQDRAQRQEGGKMEVVLSPSGLSGKCPSVDHLSWFSFLRLSHTLLFLLLCLPSGGGAGGSAEASHHSSDCLVITIMELPDDSPSSDSLSMFNLVGLYRPPSLDSLPCNLPAHKFHAWSSRSFPRCLLGALCLVSSFKTKNFTTNLNQLSWLNQII